MQPNIDQQGVNFRRVWGIMATLGAVVVGGMGFWTGMWWLFVIAGLLLAAGLFAMYEAKTLVRDAGLRD